MKEADHSYSVAHTGCQADGPEEPRRIRALTYAAGLWLCLVAALFVPALLTRHSVPGGLNYLTLLLLPGVVPAVAAAALYKRLSEPRPARPTHLRASVLFAFGAAFVATAMILAVQSIMDRDRASGGVLVGWLVVELLTIGLGNAVLAALGSYWIQRWRRRERGR